MPEYWNPELETRPWGEVLAWQRARAVALVPELRARSAFYRAKLAGAGEGDDLAALPLTTKDELRRAQDDAGAHAPLGPQQAAPMERVVQLLSSSGTTGRPLHYGLTGADVEVWRDGVANAFFTAGVRPGDVVAHLVGLPMVAGGWSYAEGFRRIGAAVAWLGGWPTARALASFRPLRVSALMATTSFLLHLVEHAPEVLGHGAAELGVAKVLGGGEPGLAQPELRERIARGWGTSHVRETMGLGDVLSSMWAECEHGGGMHFNAQAHVLVELVDPATLAPVAWREGATGEAVYTTLDREATPVLRFRSSDHLLVMGEGCPCGRTSPRVRCLGRTDDMLIYRGMNVFPSAIRDVVLRRFDGAVTHRLTIWKARPEQVRFDAPMPLEVEAGPGLARERWEGVAGAIADAVRERLQVRVDVRLVAPGTLARGDYKTALVAVRP